MWCDDNLIFLLGCTQRAVRAHLVEHLDQVGVSYEQFQALLGLAVGDDIPQNELASRLCLEPTYVARMLSRAVDQGLATRDRDQADARVQRVQLTARGKEQWQGLSALHDKFAAEALACLSDDEQQQLRQLLARLRDHVRGLTVGCTT